MEGPRREQKQFESVAGQSESVELAHIRGSDVSVGDRAFIITASGNRYMLRRSRSNGNRLTVYNERAGQFSPASGRLLGISEGQQWIAEKGKPFDAYLIDDPDKMVGRQFTSTAVVEIRIVRGLDAAANSKPADSTRSWGSSLAKQLGKITRGKGPDFERNE